MKNQKQAVESGELILAGYLVSREIKPETCHKVGPVVVSGEWTVPAEAEASVSAVRTDNGPAVSHGSVTFKLLDGSKREFGWQSGGFTPRRWAYEVLSGEVPAVSPVKPFRGVSAENAPAPGSGHSEAKASAMVCVRFAEEKVELEAWAREFVEQAFARGVNPLPVLRQMYPGQWSFSRDAKGLGLIWYVPASPKPCWRGPCEKADMPCD